jgi:hypothetical protein
MLLRRRLIPGAVAVMAAALASTGFTPGVARASTPAPRVSVISDSVLTAVTWSNEPAQAVLTAGVDLQIDAGVCRRLSGESCEFNGGHVPTALTVINGWRYQLGSVVVIVDGYNDLPSKFAGDVELTLDTLRNDGVQHVLWVNLHEVKAEYTAKNAVLRAAAKRHQEMRVLDWNRLSAGHPEWYQTDWIHLVPAGGLAIATWIHQAIAQALAPTPAGKAPVKRVMFARTRHEKLRARVGVRFDRRLRAGAGTAPLRWRTSGLGLRRARLHLSSGGEITGTPSHAGTFTIPFVVTNGRGATARIVVSLAVTPGAGHAKKS